MSKLSTAVNLLKDGNFSGIWGRILEFIENQGIGNCFTPENEIKPKYEKSLLYLKKELGVKNMGDYLEFGVSHGNSILYMFETLKKLSINSIRLFGFDSLINGENFSLSVS